MNFFKINATRYYYKPTRNGEREPGKPITKYSVDNIIKDTKNIFKWKKKESNRIKNRRVRDIKNLFELEKDYYTVKSFMVTIWNMKVMVMEIGIYQSKE